MLGADEVYVSCIAHANQVHTHASGIPCGQKKVVFLAATRTKGKLACE